jgi:hypothetical protein
MNAPQESFYSKTKRGSATASILEVFSDRELPDARPSDSRRRTLKDFAHSLRTEFSSLELAYLASAIEVEANDLRTEEGLAGSR